MSLSDAVNPTSYHKGNAFRIYFVQELFSIANDILCINEWRFLPNDFAKIKMNKKNPNK